jgi:predicted nucleotidyltransferase/HEPN domain-containing protein
MRIGTDHLPPGKQAELAEVVRILFTSFEETLSGRRAPHRVDGRILKIVLYGSHARGDWVDDPVGGYASDYDLLVVVNHDELADPVEYWSSAEETLARELTVTRSLRTPVSFIVHGLADLNRQLKRGRPFFTTIAREGTLLYDVPGHDLEASARLTPEEARTEAAQHFAEWFPSAGMFVRAGRFLRGEGGLREAAFQYHQAAERLYHCALLVVALYSPKSHRLGLLRSQAEAMTPSLAEAWPRSTAAERRPFELLRRAYVEARYSPHFRVSESELQAIDAHVDVLRRSVLLAAAERLEVPPSELERVPGTG